MRRLANKPLPAERDSCLPYLGRELALLPHTSVAVCLGGFAWDGALRVLAAPRPWPRFTHGAEYRTTVTPMQRALTLLGCYHPSQQNTFTGRLTEPMLDDVFARARELLTPG